MKNKNMVLLALAIGCGLVAAFLTAKLGANSKSDMVGVLVAAKNIDQGTKLEEIDKLFVRKPFPRESLPAEFIDDPTLLKGKTLNRTIRAGSHVSHEDVASRKPVDLPVRADGTPMKAMAIAVAPEQVVGGMVVPGKRVDIVSVERYTNGKVISQSVLQNVLVVAVNAMTVLKEGKEAVPEATTVTLAVSLKEGMILALAQKRGEVTLLMRGDGESTVQKNVRAIEGYGAKDTDDSQNSTDGGVQVARVPVPKHTITPGTKIENPDEMFVEKEMPETAIPADAVRDLAELKGKTFTKHAYAEVPVMKVALEGTVPGKASATAAAPKGPSKSHTMIIQVATQAPQYVHYDEKGRQIEAKGGNAAAAASADPKLESPAIKPEDKKDDANDDAKGEDKGEDKATTSK